MIQSCTNYFIWSATQGTPAANLTTQEELLDSTKVLNKTQKGMMALNRSIIELDLSPIPTKMLLSLSMLVCVVSVVAHLVLFALGSALQILSCLPKFWNESLKNGFHPLFFGSVNLISSPGHALLATFGSIALQIRTIGQVGKAHLNN